MKTDEEIKDEVYYNFIDGEIRLVDALDVCVEETNKREQERVDTFIINLFKRMRDAKQVPSKFKLGIWISEERNKIWGLK